MHQASKTCFANLESGYVLQRLVLMRYYLSVYTVQLFLALVCVPWVSWSIVIRYLYPFLTVHSRVWGRGNEERGK
jgi:hypothetical protein